MQNNQSHPVIDIYPALEGLGFNGAEDWWSYVKEQAEEDKVDLLISMAHLNTAICQLLLAHDINLFSRFWLSPRTINELRDIQANSLTDFAAQLIVQGHRGVSGDV